MDAKIKKRASKPSKKKEMPATVAKGDAFLPFLLSAICSVLGLMALIINKFIFPFGKDLLSPIICQLIILIIPTYLSIQLTAGEKNAAEQFRGIGIGRIRADHIFFMIFTALFMMSTSFVLNTLFYGIYKASEGFRILGIFTAGVGEYSVSAPYLILTYVIFPAIAEEVLFRGVIYTQLSRVSESFAIIISSLISALFAYTLGGFPAALFCALAYCFIRYVTGSLQACIIVHFLFNLYGIYLQTNLSKYILSSANSLLLFIVTVAIWLLFIILFCAECGRIFKDRAEKIESGDLSHSLPSFKLNKLKNEAASAIHHRPTLICAAICLAVFIAIVIIGIF